MKTGLRSRQAVGWLAAVFAMLFGVQAAAQNNPPASIAIHLAIESKQVQADALPTPQLTITNLTDGLLHEPDPERYRVQVEGPKGEPTKTMWYRQLMGEPGLPSLAVTLYSPPREIQPGLSINEGFQLKAFYDITIPGSYSVSVKVKDASGVWLQSNTVQFELLAAKP